MALITIPVAATTSTAPKPDKMIMVATNAQATIYTCPVGRKFIGQGILGVNGSGHITLGTGGTGNIQGGTSGAFSFDLYLQAGTSLAAQYAGISGIESDA